MQQLIKTNFQFNQIIQELYLNGSICRNDQRLHQLSIEAKYYVIRMKSSQYLAFGEGKIILNDAGAAYLLQLLSENGTIKLSA
jgi:hemin uptake protein HemP